jgi:uncharacterized protein YecE (DUF72 family)
MLDRYQESFDSLELNSSFYSQPTTAVLSGWRARCAKGFVFGLKVPGAITHEGGLSADLARVRAFVAAVRAGLGPALGPLLFQCPRSLTADVRHLELLAPDLPAELRVAFEFRHASWFSDARVLAFMRAHNWALCCHPNSLGRATVGQEGSATRAGASEPYALEPIEPVLTADWTYVRLHGDNDEHTYFYSDAELSAYVPAVHALRRRCRAVFVNFLNDSAPPSAMPHNARRFKQLCHAHAGEPVPKAPKEARATMQSYFQRLPTQPGSHSKAKRPRDEGGGGSAEPVRVGRSRKAAAPADVSPSR